MKLNNGYMSDNHKIYTYDVPKMKGVRFSSSGINKLLKEKKGKYFNVVSAKNKKIIIEKLNGMAFDIEEAEFVDQLVYDQVNRDDKKFELEDEFYEKNLEETLGFDLENNKLTNEDFIIVQEEVFDKIDEDVFDFEFKIIVDGTQYEFVYAVYELKILDDNKEILFSADSDENLREQVIEFFEFK